MLSIRSTTALLALCAAVATGNAGAQTNPYSVANGRILSAMQPEIRLHVDTALHYVGSQRWILYNVAQAEQHLFVQRSTDGVERFLWVQFEEYIPSSNGRYDYSKDSPVAAFGKELRTSKQLWNVPTTESRPESDGAYSRKLLREHGITLPPQMLYERFIYLPDTSRRRELMVIYAERATGAAAALPKEKLDALLVDHERRGLRSFSITSQPRP
jgi:hypothetical protein